MPYDYYDYFIEERNNPDFTEVTDKVRQNIWRESINFILSQEWIPTEDRLMIAMYYYLRYN